ncbi:MAG: hypothetical protein AAB573_04555 [Patescibacteria group bacterium]
MAKNTREAGKKGNARLELLMKLNPEFRDRVHRGDREAMVRADIVTSLDDAGGQLTGRKHPERALREDGKPHHFCNGCSDKDGCVSCDLDDLPHDQLYRWVNHETGQTVYTEPKGGTVGWERKHRNRD